jgi:hypothetical protein
MRTSRLYRGHRIVLVQLGPTWHAIVHGRTGAIIEDIEGRSPADALAKAEWVVDQAALPTRAQGGLGLLLGRVVFIEPVPEPHREL